MFCFPFFLFSLGITEGFLGTLVILIGIAYLLERPGLTKIDANSSNIEGLLPAAGLRRVKAGFPVFISTNTGKWYNNLPECKKQLGEIEIYSVNSEYPIYRVESIETTDNSIYRVESMETTDNPTIPTETSTVEIGDFTDAPK